MREKGAKPDVLVAKIAARQHGVVTTRQLTGAGLSDDGILRRLDAGRLHRMHRGVYAVGHAARSTKREWMAAVMACRRDAGDRGEKIHSGRTAAVGERGRGDFDPRHVVDPVRTSVLGYWGAALSHLSAAELWRLVRSRDGPIDVSVHGNGGKKKRQGIRAHRSRTLLPAHVTLRDGIPVTTPARTIADLRRVVSKPGKAGLISPRELRQAIRQAEVLGLPLGDEVEGDRTRSDLERDFLRLCKRFRLPHPEVNVRIGPHLVDFLWPDRRLVVETDGFAYHGGRVAFQDDRGRDLDLRARGYEVIRLAEKQVDDEPQRVAEVVSAALRVGADGRA
jgi:very-short-patch-repair endonuclease/predicted transcriptional regulator of viral defense system